jgi:hypothetical protein
MNFSPLQAFEVRQDDFGIVDSDPGTKPNIPPIAVVSAFGSGAVSQQITARLPQMAARYWHCQ